MQQPKLLRTVNSHAEIKPVLKSKLSRNFLLAGISFLTTILSGCGGGNIRLEEGEAYCIVLGEKTDVPDAYSCDNPEGYHVLDEAGRFLRPDLYLVSKDDFKNEPYPEIMAYAGVFLRDGYLVWGELEDEVEGGLKLKQHGEKYRALYDKDEQSWVWIVKGEAANALRLEELYAVSKETTLPVFTPNERISLDRPLCFHQTEYRNGKQNDTDNSCDDKRAIIFHSDGVVLYVDLRDSPSNEGYSWNIQEKWREESGIPVMMSTPSKVSWSIGENGLPESNLVQLPSRAPRAMNSYVGPSGPDFGNYTLKVNYIPYEGAHLEALTQAYSEYIYPITSKHARVLSNMPQE